MNKDKNFKIWIDADACPKIIKEHILKTIFKLRIPTHFVANSYLQLPLDPLVSFTQVKQGDDIADLYIVDHLDPNDLIITQDIPLASLVIEKGAIAINPRGELYTDATISERLSMRNFMQDLRDSGEVTGGPAPFGTKDKALFANSLNKILTKKLK